jgi:hypothetical protein
MPKYVIERVNGAGIRQQFQKAAGLGPRLAGAAPHDGRAKSSRRPQVPPAGTHEGPFRRSVAYLEAEIE